MGPHSIIFGNFGEQEGMLPLVAESSDCLNRDIKRRSFVMLYKTAWPTTGIQVYLSIFTPPPFRGTEDGEEGYP